MLIDVHCHLEMCEKPDELASEAEKKGIIIVTDGISAETNRKALDFAKKHKNVKVCLGLYPIEAIKLKDNEINEIIEHIKKNRDNVWGIGEVGLDYKESEKEEEHEKQRQVFRKFVSLAVEINKPITIHSRKAEEDCINILEELKAGKVIMHCFSGSMKLVDRIIKNNWCLSIPGNVNFSHHFQEVVKGTPIAQILCETDAPYLHPEKAWPNSSLNITASYKKIAEIKNISIKETERQIEENVKSLGKI